MNRYIILFNFFAVVLFFCSCATMEHSYQIARKKNNIESYEDFLKKYPQSDFADSATSRIEELRYQQSSTIESLKKFIEDYPDSRFLRKANSQINIKNANKQLQELMIERHNILETVFQISQERYRLGECSITELGYAAINLLTADLDFCKTNSEKIEIYEKILMHTKAIEKMVNEKKRLGSASNFEITSARALRLDVEIKLIKQKILALEDIVMDSQKGFKYNSKEEQ